MKLLLALVAFTALASALLFGPAGFDQVPARVALQTYGSPGTTFSASGPSSCSPSSVGLVSCWPGDGNANDVVGGSNGTLVDGTSFAPGKVGQAFNLDGTDDYIDVGPGFNLDAMTLAAWVFIDPATNTGERRIISKDNAQLPGPRKLFNLKTSSPFVAGNDGRAAFAVCVSVTGNQCFLEPNMDMIEAPSVLTAGWHHVAGVRDTAGGRFELYVDCVLVATKTPTVFGAIDAAVPTVIGQVSPTFNGEFFAGLIDEVQVYDRALTAEEVQSSFAGTCERIAFHSDRDSNWEIYAMDADGGAQANLTNNPGAFEADPAWSADGLKMALESDRDGNAEVYVMSADGSGLTRLTNNPSFDGDPAWSPDGMKIAFQSFRDGNWDIYVTNADGTGGPSNLTNNPANEQFAAWSPDGSKIAFESDRDGNREIYVMNPDGGAPTRCTQNLAVDAAPTYSPDGSKIAFATNRDGNHEVYVMNGCGGAVTNLTNHLAEDEFPAWSPDGTKIAFQSNRDGNSEIYVMMGDGSQQTNLTGNPAGDFGPDWGTISIKQPTNYLALAEHWAPVIYQDTDSWDPDADFITRFDFDGDFDGTNNWDNQDNLALSLDAYVYYWVVETSTNWFIGYALYHPRDWTEGCLPEWTPGPPNCHENDMEAILLTIARDGSEFGDFLLMNTVWHQFFRHYNSAQSPAVGSFWGEVQFLGSRPLIYVTSGGHAIEGVDPWTGWDDEFPSDDGIVYSYTGNAKEPSSANDREADYQLLTIQELWERRCEPDNDKSTFGDEPTFVGPAFRGDDWGTNSANAPWGFGSSDASFLGHSAPAFFSDPAAPIFENYSGLEPFSLTYTGSSYAPGPADSQTTGCVQEILGEIAWVTYDNVTEAGETTLTTSETGPPAPSGYQPGNVPLYFGLTTTSTFTGEVEVCVNYDDAEYSLEGSLEMLHDSGGGWEFVTSLRDVLLDRICGVVTGFSPFLLAQLIPSEDYDGDGCANATELGQDETLGGIRDYLNPWDFYDVGTISGPGQDGVVDLAFDILGVIQHYAPTGAPPYDSNYDRGPSAGPNAWNMTAPDGVIDLANDILGVIQQYDHRCT